MIAKVHTFDQRVFIVLLSDSDEKDIYDGYYVRNIHGKWFWMLPNIGVLEKVVKQERIDILESIYKMWR